MNIYAIRFTPGVTQLPIEECKERLLKTILKHCGSWIIAEEDPGDNLHWQGWVRTDLPDPTNLRNNITNEFKRPPKSSCTGNKLLSVQVMKGSFDDLQRYTMKGRNENDRRFCLVSAQCLEYCDAYVAKWHDDDNYYDVKVKRSKTQKHIVDEAVEYFSTLTTFKDRPIYERQRCVAEWLIEWIREHRTYPGNYIFANYINTVLLRLDRRYGDYILEQVLQKL